MKESNFQFTDPSLTSLEFKENEEFVIEKDKEIEIGTSINVSNNRISETEAIVGIIVKIGNEENSSPFCMKTEFTAKFRWAENLSEEKVGVLLGQNAPALLLSYARPIISMVTNSSHFPAYNIPFINFTESNK